MHVNDNDGEISTSPRGLGILYNNSYSKKVFKIWWWPL